MLFYKNINSLSCENDLVFKKETLYHYHKPEMPIAYARVVKIPLYKQSQNNAIQVQLPMVIGQSLDLV